MKIGYFTERPYQDPRIMGVTLTDLDLSNDIYDADLSADLFDRYIDEKVYAEEMGFDMLMLNEHHSTPFQLGGVMNVEACITLGHPSPGIQPRSFMIKLYWPVGIGPPWIGMRCPLRSSY